MSLLSGDLQLRYVARFAKTGPRAKAARLYRIDAQTGIAPPDNPVGELARLRGRFESWLPLAGRAPSPHAVLERWVGDGVEPVNDPELAALKVEELYALWSRFVGTQRTPDREAKLRAIASR